MRRWQSPLINLAYRFCRDRSRAEEMACRRPSSAPIAILPPGGRSRPFSTWLFALATNPYCSQIRRPPPVTLSFEDAPEPADPHRFDNAIEAATTSTRPYVRQSTVCPPNTAKCSRSITSTRWMCPRQPPAPGLARGHSQSAPVPRAQPAARDKLKPLMERSAPPPRHAKESLRISMTSIAPTPHDAAPDEMDPLLAQHFSSDEELAPSSGFCALRDGPASGRSQRTAADSLPLAACCSRSDCGAMRHGNGFGSLRIPRAAGQSPLPPPSGHAESSFVSLASVAPDASHDALEQALCWIAMATCLSIAVVAGCMRLATSSSKMRV